MPDETKPLSASEIEAIGAHLSNADIALPKADMVSTQELGRVLESAVAFEQRLFATIRDLQAELKRAHEIFENHVVDMRMALNCENFPLIDAAYDLQAENKRLKFVFADCLKKK